MHSANFFSKPSGVPQEGIVGEFDSQILIQVRETIGNTICQYPELFFIPAKILLQEMMIGVVHEDADELTGAAAQVRYEPRAGSDELIFAVGVPGLERDGVRDVGVFYATEVLPHDFGRVGMNPRQDRFLVEGLRGWIEPQELPDEIVAMETVTRDVIAPRADARGDHDELLFDLYARGAAGHRRRPD
jgi:hypothetical protein